MMQIYDGQGLFLGVVILSLSSQSYWLPFLEGQGDSI
jgi:hypothetical protein